MSTDAEFLQARIARTEAIIVAYENAIEAILGGAQSYQLSTGQTTEMVTKANLAALTEKLEWWEGRLQRLCARQQGGGLNVRPGW